jgi:cellulose synthase/poly-beta-1,6-N-acetylglucosamine synthase-like glycosyltransferase
MLINFSFLVILGVFPHFFPPKIQIYKGSAPVSIIVAAFNDGNALEKSLENNLKLSYPNYEIIVVYSIKSRDNTAEVANRFASQYDKVRAFSEDISKSNAQNIGIDIAQNEYLLFLDSDSFIYDGFIERALSYFDDPTIKCVQGIPIGLNATQNIATRLSWIIRLFFTFINTGNGRYSHEINFSGRGAIWRRDALIECKKFDVYNANEDLEINARIATKFPDWNGVYDDQLYLYEYFPTSITAFYFQQLRWGEGRVRYMGMRMRSFKKLNLGQKIIYSSTFLMGTLFPIIMWISMGMNFVQFFANFFHPNFSFGGGVFLLFLGMLFLIAYFIIIFIFAYRVYYHNQKIKFSLKNIIIGVFVIVYLLGLILALIGLHSLKILIQKKESELFIKVDKSEVEVPPQLEAV